LLGGNGGDQQNAAAEETPNTLMTPDGEHQKHQERGEGVELHFHAQ
jgi:hypothetical protein